MRRIRVLGVCLVWMAVILLAVQPVLATKRIYKAKLIDPDNRSVSGSALLATNPTGSGWNAQVFVRGVGGSVTEVWMSDSTHELPLCGVPGGAEATCTFDGQGNLDLETTLTSGLMAAWNWPGGAFRDALDAETVYVTVTYSSGVLSGNYVKIFP
jgi:hypothetical protein